MVLQENLDNALAHKAESKNINGNIGVHMRAISLVYAHSLVHIITNPSAIRSSKALANQDLKDRIVGGVAKPDSCPLRVANWVGTVCGKTLLT